MEERFIYITLSVRFIGRFLFYDLSEQMFLYPVPDPADVGGHDIYGNQCEGKEENGDGQAHQEDNPSAFLGNGAVFLCQEHIVKSALPGDAVFHEGLILAQGHVLLVIGFRRV